ncbi:MAG: hypothetical protein AABX40_01035 [Candidatus Hydrothermarchaeota archaeon]
MKREGSSQTCITIPKAYSVFSQRGQRAVESYTLVPVEEDFVVIREVIRI